MEIIFGPLQLFSKKLPKVNHHPMGYNLPNLVTLLLIGKKYVVSIKTMVVPG
jgi:hypothetical protein